MISGLDLSSEVPYTLKGDNENPTIWKLGIMPSYLFARISTDSQKKEVETAFKILQLCLKGWENFNVPYERKVENIYGTDLEVVPISTLEKIPLRVVSELSMKILEINQLTEAERKN